MITLAAKISPYQINISKAQRGEAACRHGQKSKRRVSRFGTQKNAYQDLLTRYTLRTVAVWAGICAVPKNVLFGCRAGGKSSSTTKGSDELSQ
jgi:hypothetical protein